MLLHSDILATASEYTIELLLWLTGAFLLGYLLRWFLGAKYRDRVAELEKDVSAWKAKSNDFEAELSSARYEKEKIAEELAACKRVRGELDLKLKACMEEKAAGGAGKEADGGYDALNMVAAATLTDSKTFASDDLKVVEGIGPKIEQLLKAASINSHIELAQTKVEKIKEILMNAGERYRLADPSTWPKQARMAAEGKWEELKEYQDFLQGGKE